MYQKYVLLYTNTEIYSTHILGMFCILHVMYYHLVGDSEYGDIIKFSSRVLSVIKSNNSIFHTTELAMKKKNQHFTVKPIGLSFRFSLNI